MKASALRGDTKSLVAPRNDRLAPFGLFGLALIARLVAWPHSDVVDADAVTRALIGEAYMHYPGWAGDGVWPPLHFYLSGLFTLLCGSRETGSVLVNTILGSAIAFPAFAFARRWSSTVVAMAVVAVVVFNPLVFRNSLQGLSEIPFFFFAVCAFNSLSISFVDPSIRGARHAVIAGAFITIASGIRYEAWALIVLLSVITMLAGRRRRLLLFIAPALVFPVIWMVTDHLAQGNLFKGVEQVIHWQGVTPAVVVPEQELRMRTLFFPVSFLLAISPIAFVLCIAGTSRMLVRGVVPKQRWIWLLLFPVFLAIMISMARKAELLLQHRFTMTLILLFIPFLILGFAALRSHTLILGASLALCVSGLAFSGRSTERPWLDIATAGSATEKALFTIRDYTLHELEPVPVLDTRLPDHVVEKVNALAREKRLLVLEFFGWQETYNVALRSNIRATSIVFLPERTEDGIAKLDDYLKRISGFDGILLLEKNGAYIKALNTSPEGRITWILPNRQLHLSLSAEVDNIAIYLFETSDRAVRQ